MDPAGRRGAGGGRVTGAVSNPHFDPLVSHFDPQALNFLFCVSVPQRVGRLSLHFFFFLSLSARFAFTFMSLFGRVSQDVGSSKHFDYSCLPSGSQLTSPWHLELRRRVGIIHLDEAINLGRGHRLFLRGFGAECLSADGFAASCNS